MSKSKFHSLSGRQRNVGFSAHWLKKNAKSKWTLITAAKGPSGFDPVGRAEDAGSPVSTFLHAQHTTSSDEHVFLSRQSEKTPILSSPSYLLRAACARVSAAAGAHVGPDASAAVQTLQLTASW